MGRDGDTVVILLTGGTKKRQQRDISKPRQRCGKLTRRRSVSGVEMEMRGAN